jgi:hypothetical protein
VEPPPPPPPPILLTIIYDVLLGRVSTPLENDGAVDEAPLKLIVEVPADEVAYTARSCPPPPFAVREDEVEEMREPENVVPA